MRVWQMEVLSWWECGLVSFWEILRQDWSGPRPGGIE